MRYTYPTSPEYAAHLADVIALNTSSTWIEPSPHRGYWFTDPRRAVLFRMRFHAEGWAAKEGSDYLLYPTEAGEFVEQWLADYPGGWHEVEFVTVIFGSAQDRRRFEDALWN